MTNRWAVLGLLCFARVSMGLHFQSVAVVAPLLIESLGLTYAQLGVLIGLYTVPGIFLSLPGGLLAARFGDRAVVLGALGLLTVGGVLFANSGSFAAVLLARLIVGAGGVILSVQLTKITTDWFAGKEISTALGLLLAMWPLGLAVALATLGKLATTTSWRTAVYATSAYAALSLLLVAVLYREPRLGGGETRRPARWTISRRELGLLTLCGLSWMFLNAGFIVFMSFAPTLLMDRGRSLPEAGFLLSWASLVSIGSIPLAGYVVDRTRRADLLIVAGSVASAAVIFLFAAGEPALLWILLFGVVLGAPVPVVALPSEVLRPESRSTGFGVWQTVYHVGMAVVPPLAGFLLDVTRSARAPLVFAGVLWLLIIPPLVAFRSVTRRGVTAAAAPKL